MTKMVFLWYGILKEENRMRKSIFQKMSAVFLSMTLVVGMAASVPAAVKKVQTSLPLKHGNHSQFRQVKIRMNGKML